MQHEVGMIEFACRDVARVAAFWSAMLEVPVDPGASDEYAQLSPPAPSPKWLFLRREPAGTPGSVMLAITTADARASADAVVALGGTAHGIREQDGLVWADLADPEGTPFTCNEPPPA